MKANAYHPSLSASIGFSENIFFIDNTQNERHAFQSIGRRGKNGNKRGAPDKATEGPEAFHKSRAGGSVVAANSAALIRIQMIT